MRRGVPIGLAFATILLAGCSASTPRSEMTCGEYDALPVERRADYATHDTTVFVYRDDIAEKLTERNFLDRECQDPGNADVLIGTLGRGIGKPTCSRLLALDAPAQRVWYDVIDDDLSLGGFGGPSTMTFDQRLQVLLRACEEQVVETPEAEVSLALARLSGMEAVRFFHFAGLDADWRILAWATTSRLGYTVDSELRVGPPATESLVHPVYDSSYAVGEACDFDRERDLAIPFVWFAEDTTESSIGDVDTLTAFEVHAGSREISSISIEVEYDRGGTRCFGPSSAEEVAATSSGRVTLAGFFVVLDYFSPAYPDGVIQELASYRLSGSGFTGEDPTAVLTTEASLTLGG